MQAPPFNMSKLENNKDKIMQGVKQIGSWKNIK